MEKQQNIEMEPGFTHTPPRIKLSQYDFGYNLYLDMKDKGTAWSIPSNLEVRIMGTKGDGHGFDYGPSDGITYSGSRVTVPLKQQMTTWAGDTTVEVIFKSGTNMRIGSANFILEVEPAGMADDTRPSDSDIPALQIIAELAVRLDGLVDDLEQAVDDAQDAADSAAISATNAANSASAAASSANSAASSASAASTSESNAAGSATSANTSATSASASAANAQKYARIAHSWANGDTSPDEYGTSVDNAKYWYQQARDVASGVVGGIKPMGTCAFANLPSLSSAKNGDMYNISDAFTTDSRFKEGSGIPIAAGAEVYKTSDGYWSVMATNRVTSVNGSIGDVVINYKDMAIGTCTTAASTAAKKVTLSNSDKWVLREGAMIAVKFTYSNTAANMTIEVGSTGAKRVWMNGAVTSSGFSGTSAGHYSYFVFDGTYWVWLNYDYDTDNDTTYEGMSVAEMTTGTATTLRTITAANLSSGLTTLVPAKLGISSSGSEAKFLNQKGQWTTISFPDSPVASVNGKTGVVTLDANDVGALPNSTSYVSSFNGQTGAITYTAPVTSVAGATGAVAASSVLGYPSTSTAAGADTQYMLVQSSSSGTWSRKSLSTLKAYFQEGITSGVSSVNNKTGAVNLTASDVGALPDSYSAPVTSVNSKTGAVTLTASDVGAMPDTYTAPVTSVNGKTGAVTLTASDVGALASGTDVDKVYQVATTTSTAYPVLLSYNTTSSTKTTYSRFNSSFTYNPSTKVLAIPSGGDITIGGTSIVGSGAVTSVNGQTGAVTLTASDVGAMPDTYTAPVTSVAGSTGAVTSKTILSDPSTSTTAGADTQYMLVQASSTGTWYRKSLSTLKDYFGGSAGTDENVKQTVTTTNSSYPVLFSYTTSTSANKTEGARIAASFTYNPSTKTLNVPSGGDITIDGTSVKNAVTSVAGETGAVTAAKILSYPSTSTTAGADTQYMLVQASSTGTWYRKSLSKLKEYFGGSAGTDENVKQTITTTNSSYPMLFSYSTSTSTKTEGARMASSFTYNPSTKLLSIPADGDVKVGTISVKNYLINPFDGGHTTSFHWNPELSTPFICYIDGSTYPSTNWIFGLEIQSLEVSIYGIRIGAKVNSAGYVGSYGVAIGRDAQAAYAGVSIGDGAGDPSTLLEYAIAIGNGAKAGKKSVAIGNGAGNTSSSNTFHLGSGDITTLSCQVQLSVWSDERDKTDIHSLSDSESLAFINNLFPVQYVRNPRELYLIDRDNLDDADKSIRDEYKLYKYDKASHSAGDKKGTRLRVGLIAQEVQQALETVYGSESYANIVNDNLFDIPSEDIPEGVENQLTVSYDNIIPFLIGAVKELTKRIEVLERK